MPIWNIASATTQKRQQKFVRVTILLEERVDTGDAAVPAVLKIFQRQATILGIGLLALHGVL